MLRKVPGKYLVGRLACLLSSQISGSYHAKQSELLNKSWGLTSAGTLAFAMLHQGKPANSKCFQSFFCLFLQLLVLDNSAYMIVELLNCTNKTSVVDQAGQGHK